MLSLSKNHNINYLARIVKISNLRRHSNADRLQCTSIDGNNVILGLEQKEGDVGIYFPLACQINEEFLKANNLFRKGEMNADSSKIGFFEPNGRVKPVKLRGEKSEGFWIPINSLATFVANYDDVVVHEGEDFDTVNGHLLVKKYRIGRIPRLKDPSEKNKQKKAAKKRSILVENQFHFHIDTPQLGKNIWKFSPNDFISITQKLHGTSFISSKVLTLRKLSLLERVSRWFGCKIEETEYKNLYASRRVIKNIGENVGSFYKEDIWGEANAQIEPHLKDGMTVYGEIVGFLSDGGAIQKGYDYGCAVGKHRIFVYRITWTLPNGHVVEWSWGQIKDWCRFHGLDPVPELYRGTVEQFLNNDIEELMKKYHQRSAGELFLEVLKDRYLEKKAKNLHANCIRCVNDVWDEGIVVRKEDAADFDVYKLKSFNFFEHESKLLDSGGEDLEEETAEIVPE